MKGDENGIDTVLGALILILVCVMASSALIAVDQSSNGGTQDVWDLERRFDCVLSSTLDLSYVIDGSEIVRPVSVEAFAIEKLGSSKGDLPPSSSNASEGISSLIDFYFGGFDGWNLRLVDGNSDPIELAFRGQSSIEGEETYILSRPLTGADGGVASLDLTLFR